jgi:uncharacterized protein with von Willebrand factor type A (vWA) domain
MTKSKDANKPKSNHDGSQAASTRANKVNRFIKEFSDYIAEDERFKQFPRRRTNYIERARMVVMSSYDSIPSPAQTSDFDQLIERVSQQMEENKSRNYGGESWSDRLYTSPSQAPEAKR